MTNDAKYVEKWLLNKWGDIIKLFDQFIKETGWKIDRCNKAFHEVFYNSKKVTW